MLELVPEFLPLRTELVYATGVLEILGAAALLVPRLHRLTSIALILFLIAVFPGNVYGALQHASIGGHELGPIYLLVRAPFQAFLIWMLYRFGVQSDLAKPGQSNLDLDSSFNPATDVSAKHGRKAHNLT
jgi:uncharacterized membrane protein